MITTQGCSARLGDCRCGSKHANHAAGAGLHWCSAPDCGALWANSGLHDGMIERPYVVVLPTSPIGRVGRALVAY
jgi:hypothetical protein